MTFPGIIAIIPEFRGWLRKWYVTFFAIALLVGVVAALSGCAGDPAKPRAAAEEFPARNQDPRVGLVVNSGTAPSNLYVYNQANQLVEQTYMSGADRFLLNPNGQPYPQYWIRRLELGCYRIEVLPFYHGIRLIPPATFRIDLPKQTNSVCVGNNPTTQYYGGSHWGWILYMGTNIPEGGVGNGNAFPPLLQIVNPFGQR